MENFQQKVMYTSDYGVGKSKELKGIEMDAKMKNSLIVIETHVTARIDYSDIVYIECRGRDTLVTTERFELMIKRRMEDISSELEKNSTMFCRMDKRRIINLEKVDYMMGGVIYLSNGREVRSSKSIYLKARKCYREYISRGMLLALADDEC